MESKMVEKMIESRFPWIHIYFESHIHTHSLDYQSLVDCYSHSRRAMIDLTSDSIKSAILDQRDGHSIRRMTVHTPHFCLPEFSRAGLQGRRVFKLTKAAFITKGEGRRSANCAVGKLFNSREYFSGGKRRMFSTNWPRKRVVILVVYSVVFGYEIVCFLFLFFFSL